MLTLWGTDGWRRVNTELVYGHGVIVNPKTVRKIMRIQGLCGLPGPREGFRSETNIATTADLVDLLHSGQHGSVATTPWSSPMRS